MGERARYGIGDSIDVSRLFLKDGKPEPIWFPATVARDDGWQIVAVFIDGERLAVQPQHVRRAPMTTRPSHQRQDDQAGELSALVEFAKTVIRQECWEGGENGGEYQELALKLGLIRQTTYDPKVHGEAEYDAELGGDWFVFAGPLAPHVAPETPVKRDGGAS